MSVFPSSDCISSGKVLDALAVSLTRDTGFSGLLLLLRFIFTKLIEEGITRLV